MPLKDSQWNYVHMTNPHHVLYREKWINDKLPFDDIDFHSILMQQQQKQQFQMVNFLNNVILMNDDEQEELNVTMGQTQFGASRNHKKLFTNNVWKDLDLRNFLDSKPEDHEEIKDKTILKSVDDRVYGNNAIDYDEEEEDGVDNVLEVAESFLDDEKKDDKVNNNNNIAPPEFMLIDEAGDTVMEGNGDNTIANSDSISSINFGAAGNGISNNTNNNNNNSSIIDPSVTPLITRSKKRYFYQTPVSRGFR